MGTLRRLIYRLRWGELDARKQRGLSKLYDTLAATSLHGKYWITGGLLLGCVRDGRPIAYDADCDFSIWDHDVGDLLHAIEVLRSEGFYLRHQQFANDGKVVLWALMYQGVKYEFYRVERANDRARWYLHRRKPPMEIINEIPAYDVDELTLLGRTWLKPADAPGYLTAVYGDWRSDNPNYCYWRDCRATVDRQAWTYVGFGRRRSPAPLRPLDGLPGRCKVESKARSSGATVKRAA